jgi:hypothetical protein
MLTIYAPFNNKNSKAWEVFDGITHTWPEQVQTLDNLVEVDPKDNSMFWGFVNNNLEMIKKLEARKQNFWFTDTPYFGRFDNANLKPNNHYWRMCQNSIHAKFIKDIKSDRFEKFGINVRQPDNTGTHILICPSSASIHNYIDSSNWIDLTIEKLKRVTDRPIRLRHKPRGRGTSGPSEAKVPLSEDLKDAWACVTSCSISAVEAVCMGKPVFCHEKSFAKALGNIHLENIETPFYADPFPWLYSLAYQQFTPEEFSNGTACGILKDIGVLI